MVRIKLNWKGVNQLLKSQELSGECKRYASHTLARAGEGYAMQTRTYAERNGYAVVAVTQKAYRDNAKYNTLLKAVGK